MQTRNILTLTSLATFMIMTSGCASLKVEKHELAQVKKVAIVGLSVEQQKAVEAGDLFKIATRQKMDDSAKVSGRMESAHVSEIYESLSSELKSEQKIQVISQKELMQNATYNELFKDKTEGWQNRPQIAERFNLMQAPGILDHYAIMMTKPEVLKKLQEDLKVDALILASVHIDLNNSGVLASMVGQGEFSPSARTYFRMFDARSEKEIWMDASAEGQKVSNKEKNFMGMAEEQKLNKLAVEAAKSSTHALMLRSKDSNIK